MGKGCLPPGFRFHPTDVELVKYYLKRKVMGRKLHLEAISELDIYKHAPWDLPDKSVLSFRDLKWYFFCPVEKKYAKGARKSRATELGYWKTTGRDRPIHYGQDVVGMIKTLIFHRGKAPKGDRTDWVMHEYRLEDKELAERGVVQDAYVLCVVFEKDGPGPRNGAQYGAPFKEEDWSDDEVEDGPGALSSVALCAQNLAVSSNTNPVGSVATDPPFPETTSIVPLVEPVPEEDLLSYYETLPGICLADLSAPAHHMFGDALDAPTSVGGSSMRGKGDDISSMMNIFTEESSLRWNNDEQRFEVNNSDAVFCAALPSQPSSLDNVSWNSILAGTGGACLPPGQSTETHGSHTLPSASKVTATASPTFLPTCAQCHHHQKLGPPVSDDDDIGHMLANFCNDPVALYP